IDRLICICFCHRLKCIPEKKKREYLEKKTFGRSSTVNQFCEKKKSNTCLSSREKFSEAFPMSQSYFFHSQVTFVLTTCLLFVTVNVHCFFTLTKYNPLQEIVETSRDLKG